MSQHAADRGASLSDLRGWLRRAGKHISVEDLQHVGPLGVWNIIAGFSKAPDRLNDWTFDLDARDTDFVELVTDAARAIGKTWFRYSVRGIEHVPSEGPVLLVGNHNGGIMPIDTFLTLTALWDRFGPGRAVNPLGHDLLAFDPVGRRLSAKLGILRASEAAASAALRDGRIVLVYPGSDMDSWRPWWHRDKVHFAERKGFVRLALREDVPIVPVVSVGTHEQLIVLSRGRFIARRLGLQKRLRTTAFPIVWALPWGLTSGYLPYLPLPAQTTLAFGSPLRWRDRTSSDADRPAVVDACYDEVVASMQALLTLLVRRRVPWLGDPARLVPRVLRDWVRGAGVE
jgi:1-acyl-sn-glycerol-3-phosphate acyltransferase